MRADTAAPNGAPRGQAGVVQRAVSSAFIVFGTLVATPNLARADEGDPIGSVLLRCMSPLLAQSGHTDRATECLLLGVKQTSDRRASLFAMTNWIFALNQIQNHRAQYPKWRPRRRRRGSKLDARPNAAAAATRAPMRKRGISSGHIQLSPCQTDNDG